VIVDHVNADTLGLLNTTTMVDIIDITIITITTIANSTTWADVGSVHRRSAKLAGQVVTKKDALEPSARVGGSCQRCRYQAVWPQPGQRPPW